MRQTIAYLLLSYCDSIVVAFFTMIYVIYVIYVIFGIWETLSLSKSRMTRMTRILRGFWCRDAFRIVKS